jgi:hypothetical protein
VTQSTAPLPRTALGTLQQLTRGGQARIYTTGLRLPERPDWPLLYKEYLAPQTIRQDVLRQLVEWRSNRLQPQRLDAVGAWPLRAVTDGGALVGFLMRSAPADYMVDLRLGSTVENSLFEVQHVLQERQYREARGIQVDDRWRLELLQDVARALDELHGQGIAVGDLSPKNLLTSITGRPRCFFLDLDAVSLRGASILEQVDTPDWETWPGERRGTQTSDCHKLGLLAVRLFAEDLATRDVLPLAAVSPELASFARAALGPRGGRPVAGAWARQIEVVLTRLPAEPFRPEPPPEPVFAGATTSGDTGRWVPPASPAPSPGAWSGPPARVRIGPRVRHKGRWVLALVTAAVVINPSSLHPLTEPIRDGLGSLSGFVTQKVDERLADDEAQSVQDVLKASAADRSKTVAAVRDVSACRDLADAAAELSEAVRGRQAGLDRVRSLDLSHLGPGVALKQHLSAALSASLTADQAYLRWARNRQLSKCSKASAVTRDTKAAAAASTAARKEKARVVVVWTPVAQQHGLSPFGRDQF